MVTTPIPGLGFDLDAREPEITELVRTASRRALRWYRTGHEVENKLVDGFDPVTEADRAVEDELRAGLGRLFPDHAILGEERGLTGDGPVRWVIDPIDGTRAFIIGHALWGTLVGLQADSRPVAGWMHQPVLDETHIATPSGGRLEIGQRSVPLATRPTTVLADAVLAATHPEMFGPGDRPAFDRLAAAVRMTRYGGDCANYGLLAAGHLDLVVESGLASYDILALVPIITAAGGVVTDIDGRTPLDGGFVVAAATPQLHRAALEVLTAG
jgi:histidinol phosphatase-like enzyme (inositol monophosphatase family)